MIDAHCHLGPGLRARRPTPLYETDTAEKLLPLLDRVGIRKAVVFAPGWQGGSASGDFVDPGYEKANAAIAAEVSRYPDRLIGFARINPKFGGEAARELARCFDEYGFRGLKLDNCVDGYDPTDLALLAPLAEICRQRRAPILVHTGFPPADPLVFLPLAQAFPDVPVIFEHMGGRILGDAVITAQHAGNIYFEISGQQPAYLIQGVKVMGASRLIFGTDLPYNIPEVEVERVRSLGLEEAEIAQITGGNLAGLLGIEG